MKFQAVFCVFLFMSFNSFSQWEQQESNTMNDLNAIHFLNDSTGFVIGDNGVFLKTNNRGQSWDLTVINSSDDLHSIFALNEDTIYTGGDNLYLTNDGGQNWNTVPGQTDIQEIKFFSSEIGFIKTGYMSWCGYPSVYSYVMKYLRTTDGGNTWQDYTGLPGNYSVGEIDIVTADTGYLAGGLGFFDFGECFFYTTSRIHKTTDGGMTWDEVPVFSYSGSNVDASFLDGWEGYLLYAESGCRLYKINGGGSEFVFISDITGNSISNLAFATLNEGYYTSAGKIMRTTSGGISWVEDYDGTTGISNMVITKNYEGYAIGNSGLILHKKIIPSNGPLGWLNIDETALAFPKTNISEESYSSFVLISSGNADITINVSAPPNFKVKPENANDYTSEISGLVIPAQRDTTILVAFRPNAYVYFQDTLIITSNAENNPLIKLPVSGKGIYTLPEIISNDTIFCADTVWLRNHLTVEQGKSLTFCPGTMVVVPFTLTDDVDININGSLYAIGKQQDSIYFVVDRPDLTWDGIDINGDNAGDSVFIHYCHIKDAFKNNYQVEDNGGAIAVNGNKYVSIMNTMITNCRSHDHGGGIYSSGGDCVIRDCIFIDCGSGYGGGLYLANSPGHSISNCDFYDCVGTGGGICYFDGDSLQISNCTFSDCQASEGGALFLAGNCYQVIGSQVTNCTATNGGGMYLAGSGPSLVENVKIQGCISDEGGGIFIDSGSGISIMNCVISGCNTDISGGGIADLTGSGLIVKNCTINNNLVHDGNGGGIWISGDSPLISGNDIHHNNAFNFNNTSAGKGGGIYGMNASPHITDNLLHDNTSDGVGACIYLEKNLNDLTAEIKQNLLYRNMAYYMNNGGGIYLKQSKCSIVLNTLTRNTGGGIYCDQPDSTRIYGNIIFNNTPIDLFSTDDAIDVSFCDINGGWLGSGIGNIDADPLFYGSLNYPYFWDKVDYSVKPESPCIDTGIPDTTGWDLPYLDLAGNTRFAGVRLDMGAFENHFLYQTIDTGFCQGEDFTLEVVPDHEGAYQAQWSFNGEIIEGAENNTLLIDNPGPENGGIYNCTLDFADLTLFSRYIGLYNKGFAPEIQEQPVGSILNLGDDYTLELFAYSIDLYTLYQWYRNDTILDGANHSWLDITGFSRKDAGTYKCRVENTCGELFSDEVVLQLTPSGIEEFSGGKLEISPNPASRQLTVVSRQSAVGSRQSAVRIEIYDLFGRKMMSFEDVFSFPFNIDISSLSPGMYILQIIDDDGASGSVKFLKVSR